MPTFVAKCFILRALKPLLKTMWKTSFSIIHLKPLTGVRWLPLLHHRFDTMPGIHCRKASDSMRVSRLPIVLNEVFAIRANFFAFINPKDLHLASLRYVLIVHELIAHSHKFWITSR